MNHPFGLPAGTKWRDLRTPSVMSLIAANLIPLFGTIFLGWGGVVLILYWYETAVIGGYSILKLPFALRWYALLAGPFFIVHFGLFITFSGAFALGLYGIVDGLEGTRQELLRGIRGELLIFVPAVVVSHGVFVRHQLHRQEGISAHAGRRRPHGRTIHADLRHVWERLPGRDRDGHNRGPGSAYECFRRPEDRSGYDRAPEGARSEYTAARIALHVKLDSIRTRRNAPFEFLEPVQRDPRRRSLSRPRASPHDQEPLRVRRDVVPRPPGSVNDV